MEYFALVVLNLILLRAKAETTSKATLTQATTETSSVLSDATTENKWTFNSSAISSTKDPSTSTIGESSKTTSAQESTVNTSAFSTLLTTTENITSSSVQVEQTTLTPHVTEGTSMYASNGTTKPTADKSTTTTTSTTSFTSTSTLSTTNTPVSTPLFSTSAKDLSSKSISTSITTTTTIRTTSPSTVMSGNTDETTIDRNQNEINDLKKQISDLEEKKFYFFITVIVLGSVLGLLLLLILIVCIKKRNKVTKSPFEEYDLETPRNAYMTRQPILRHDDIFSHNAVTLEDTDHNQDQKLETFSRAEENKQRISKLQMIKDGLTTPDRYSLLVESHVSDVHNDELNSHETHTVKPPDEVSDKKPDRGEDVSSFEPKKEEEKPVSNAESPKEKANPVDGIPVIVVEETAKTNNEPAGENPQEVTDNLPQPPLPPPPPELQVTSNSAVASNENHDKTQTGSLEGQLIDLHTPN